MVPSSTSCMTTAAVNVLDTDANANARPVVIGSLARTLASPEEPAQARPSSHTIATERPGTPVFLRQASMAVWRRVLGTPASGSTAGAGVSSGVAEGAGASGVEDGGTASGLAPTRESTGEEAAGGSVPPATAMLPGFRLADPSRP